MTSALDLTGDIAAAVNGAAGRGHALAVGYVDGDGFPVTSFRGSVQVHGPGELALWARKRTDGLVTSIADRPKVTLLYYDPEGPGAAYLSVRGRARVDETANDAVYAGMIEGERQQDPDRNGVAVVIEVESVLGAGAAGYFQQERAAGVASG
jgi:hypothetical protein